MGQTLTHGVYLPDEGERNCYNGLAGNWTILDGAVGTVAEHTTQIAGKANAVHTHTKSDITDFPAYGATAGTICEGNDSRLSDARTPVAHTHSKADITDLFNSANTWTGDNTYTKYQNIVIDGTEIGVAPNAKNSNGLLFKDKNGVNIGWLRHQYGASGDISIEMLVSNKYKNGALDPTGTQVYQGVKQVLDSNGVSYFNWSGYVNNSLYPYTTETFNIGDSTHQWNNLYAKKVNTQSVNGINPGALSLPDISKYTDLTSNIPSASLDGITNIDLSSYITNNGWLSIVVPDTNTDDFVFVQVMGTLANRYFMSGARGAGFISLMMPINRGGDVLAKIKASSVTFCRFYQCLGNV